MSWREGKVGSWGRQARWRTDLQWWGVAPVLSLLAYAIYLGITGASFGPTDDTMVDVYPVLFFFSQGTRQSGFFALYLVGVVGLSVILGWLYTRSQGRVLLTTVFHAQWNVFDSGKLFSVGDDDSFVGPGCFGARHPAVRRVTYRGGR